MPASPHHADDRWRLLADWHFREFDELAQSIRGWGVDFRQLKPGRSPTQLLQFGSPDLLITRFQIDQPYDQRGSTPPDMFTLGFVERGSGKVFTPEGTVTESEIWCFSADREFSCASQSDFRAYGMSLSESLVDEVADVCEFRDVREVLGVNQVVRCPQRADVDAIRNRLVGITQHIRSGKGESKFGSLGHARALELDLVRQVLETLAGPLEVMRLPMTGRKQLVLRRTLEYLDANPDSYITVHDLAEVVGAGVRTLEYVFKDYFGVPPKAYLTARRLWGARRELIRSDPKDTLVCDVAHNWGFWHLGRFAMDYRRFFGELPSQALGTD
jgi:AraC family ethanolamine operon transcriptional activator